MTQPVAIGDPSVARVLIWNRTEHLICRPPFVAAITRDSGLSAELIRQLPDLIWIYGPAPSPQELAELQSLIPGLEGVARTRLDLSNAGHGLQVIAGQFQKAQDSVKGFRRLQSMPAVAQHIMQAVEAESTTARELTEMIAPDPALTATILRHANSPLHGLVRKVTDIQSAIVILGLRQVGELAMAASVVDVFQEKDKQAEIMWKRRLLVAATATRLGRKMIQNPKVQQALFVSGMLHDIGLSVLRHIQPDFFRMHLPQLDNQEGLYRETLKMFDFHPGDLGGALAKQWNLPMEVEISARYHHTPRCFEMDVATGDLALILWSVMVAVAITDALMSAAPGDLLLSRIQVLAAVPQIDAALRRRLPETVDALRKELVQAMERK